MRERIEITIDPRGGVRAETQGFSGPSCLAASRFLEEALGEQIGRERTAAFYQSAHQQQHAQQGNG